MSTAQTVNGNGNGVYPAGMTQMQPALAEAQCSVNLFFEVEGYGKGQATGRGRTAQEAAANLKATIDETRAAFAPPAPMVPPSREAQVAALLTCGIQKATLRNDWERIERLSKAAALILSGAVAKSIEGWYTVISQRCPTTIYDVTAAGECQCKDFQRHLSEPAWFCKHSLSVLMMQRLEAN